MTVELQRLYSLQNGIDYVLDYLKNPELEKTLLAERYEVACAIAYREMKTSPKVTENRRENK